MEDVVTRFEDVHEKENAYVTRHAIQDNHHQEMYCFHHECRG